MYRHMIQFTRKLPEIPHLVIMDGPTSVAGIRVDNIGEEDHQKFGDAVVQALRNAEERGRETLQEELRSLLGARAE